MSVPVVLLNDGYKMPGFGFGTYSLKGPEGEEVIKYAIEIGYRLIDTASLYHNEKEVGNAVRDKIKDGTVTRDELFITTKLNSRLHGENEVINSLKESLKNLGLDYVDLFLIHSPISTKDFENPSEWVPTDIDYVETWRGMEECKNQGLARSIGISNFNSEQVDRLISNSTIKPVNNQVEVNLNLPQKQLIEFCKKYDVSVTAYSPLGKPGKFVEMKNVWAHPSIVKLSKKYNKTPAQISLRFVLQMGTVPIPKSATKSRIKENFDIFDFQLTDDEINEISNLGTGTRVVTLESCRNAKYYPFNIPF